MITIKTPNLKVGDKVQVLNSVYGEKVGVVTHVNSKTVHVSFDGKIGIYTLVSNKFVVVD